MGVGHHTIYKVMECPSGRPLSVPPSVHPSVRPVAPWYVARLSPVAEVSPFICACAVRRPVNARAGSKQYVNDGNNFFYVYALYGQIIYLSYVYLQ